MGTPLERHLAIQIRDRIRSNMELAYSPGNKSRLFAGSRFQFTHPDPLLLVNRCWPTYDIPPARGSHKLVDVAFTAFSCGESSFGGNCHPLGPDCGYLMASDHLRWCAIGRFASIVVLAYPACLPDLKS